ncbi:MAG: alpha-L-glutamate ligase [Alphaproteobacteria bacterium]|nr:alpha-L-glutamate ligase [Alphaproteobacteria bacterium]MCB9796004.1 alpha-L-glutamate ligase [Alphaproteobacteria bacterium]
MTVHVLYENADWIAPLEDALRRRGLPYRLVFVNGGALDLAGVPAPGVYINRMSPSSHTRGHQGGVRYVGEVLRHLEAHGRPVINGSRAFDLEVSKVRQDLALRAAGVRTPHTIAVVGKEPLKEAARRMPLPFITKHNQGGKGLGVQLFRDLEAFDRYVDSPDFVDDPGGVTLLQEYIQPPEPFITRVEIVDGELLYAIRSSTEGGFELCPADACAIEDAQNCPVGDTGKFSLREDITADDPLVARYVALMRANDIDVAGIEFVEDAQGRRYTYDINGTTNYNGQVEAAHGLDGMGAIAALAERLLQGEQLAAK